MSSQWNYFRLSSGGKVVWCELHVARPAAVSRLEELGIDSLWLSEMVYGPLVEPLTGMAYALARTARLKVGTGVSVLPGRHPVLVAKQLASLAGLAPARVLPVFGLQPAGPRCYQLASRPSHDRGVRGGGHQQVRHPPGHGTPDDGQLRR